MATHRNVRKTLGFYTIKRINTTIRIGDCVLMAPPDPSIPQYVAQIMKIQSIGRRVQVKVKWFYRPEETKGGREVYHGVNEVFLSDHYDTQSVDSIESKCTVHDFTSYTRSNAIENKDFYCRFKYLPITGDFYPDNTLVYCTCEMPYNPDDLMIQCEECNEWYHPACISMSVDEARGLEHFICQKCLNDDSMEEED